MDVKILIVDDSKTALLTTSHYLKKLGHDVVATANPLEAESLFINESPDLVILDVMMDALSGYDCARQIREAQKDNTGWIPIIFLSAEVDDTAIHKGIDAGGDDYLTKPFSELTLAAKIKAMDRIADMRNQLIINNNLLEKLSTTDTLTKIPNRHQFEKLIETAISMCKRHHRKFALLFIDLDNFKFVNDTLGHYAGDLLLVEATKRIHSVLREGDSLARLGGDEFAAIINDVVDPQNAADAAQRIIEALQPSFNIKRNSINITSSIGISFFPDSGESAYELIKNSDLAMYQAKANGRNNYVVFSDKIQKKYIEKINFEFSLRNSVKNGEFLLLYQPIYDLKTREIIAIESLVRWNHQQLGLLEPDKFISLAEETGMILEIGKWIIHNSCADFSKLIKMGFTTQALSINLSPHQLLKQDLVDFLKITLDEYSIPGVHVNIEITETAIMTHDIKWYEILKSVHDLGITIAIDDFGTGYSSLSHIRQLPIDALKIDQSFVSNIPQQKDDIAIIKAVIQLSKSLNLNVIAEGVETEEQCKFLIENGCTIGQGFLLAKPMPFDQLKKFIFK